MRVIMKWGIFNMRNNLAMTLLIVATFGMAISCTQGSFSTKSNVIENKSVFAAAAGDEESIDENSSDETPGNSENPVEDPNGTPVEFLCSDVRSEQAGSNVVESKKLELRVIDQDTNAVVCSTSNGIRESVVNYKKLSLSACAGMTKDSYDIALIDPDKNSEDLLFDRSYQNDNFQLVKENGSYSIASKLFGGSGRTNIPQNNDTISLFDDEVFVLYNKANRFGSNRNLAEGEGVGEGKGQDEGEAEKCDEEASPLIVDTSSHANSSGIQLTSILEGILFDILGFNSFPFAHTAKQISWIKSSEYMFVVKPNSFGSVKGINDMFGNNTLGPDGKFAANGFVALAKYDSNSDKAITNEDAVFSELRLWSDKNRDGKSQAGELYSLSEMGIVEIDLDYDPNYSETDKYGNKVELKSVIKYSNGKIHLIFDLWFRYM